MRWPPAVCVHLEDVSHQPAQSLTGNLHLQERQDLQDEDRYPAKRVSDDNGEESLCYGHLLLDMVTVLGGLCTCSLDVVKHASI